MELAHDILSAGDGPACTGKNKEVNNNEVEALSLELSHMGCIVDAVRAPPGCAETAVETDVNADSSRSDNRPGGSEEDAYLSEVFEESESEGETPTPAATAVPSAKTRAAHARSAASETRRSRASGDARSASRYGDEKSAWRAGRRGSRGRAVSPYSQRLSSQTSLSRIRNIYSSSSRSRRWTRSLPVPQTRRINMSFTNDRLRDIERENHILLDKIMSARNSKRSSIPPAAPAPPPLRTRPAAASVHRRQQQRRIDRDNMILLRKIERASSSSCSRR